MEVSVAGTLLSKLFAKFCSGCLFQQTKPMALGFTDGWRTQGGVGVARLGKGGGQIGMTKLETKLETMNTIMACGRLGGSSHGRGRWC